MTEELKGKIVYLGKGIGRDYYLNFRGEKNKVDSSAQNFDSIEHVVEALANPERNGIDSKYLGKRRKFSMIIDDEISDEDLSYLVKEKEKRRIKLMHFERARDL